MQKGVCIPQRVHTVVISIQHSDDVTLEKLRKDLMDKVVAKVIPAKYLDERTVFHMQPSGRFVIGGPQVGMGHCKLLVSQQTIYVGHKSVPGCHCKSHLGY